MVCEFLRDAVHFIVGGGFERWVESKKRYETITVTADFSHLSSTHIACSWGCRTKRMSCGGLYEQLKIVDELHQSG